MLSHYLMFDRNCMEAIKTYEKAFNAKVAEIQKYGDMPANPAFPIPEADKDLVLHARLHLDGQDIMCADSSRGDLNSGSNMYISITTKDAAFVQRAWDTLAPNGKVAMALAPSFFASLHGSLRDQFGVNWMFTVLK